MKSPAALPRPAGPLLLGAAALVLFAVAIGQGALWDVDEAKYTEIARQIVRRGDPITLYWNEKPWFDKPPLHLWLVAATGALFGFTEFTARIWTALLGAIGVVVTYLLGRRLYDGRTGFLAGVILMTTLEYFVLSRMALLDVPLVVFMLLALYMVVVAGETEPSARAQRRRAYRWAFVWAGLATLTKGPIGLVLPALVVGGWWMLLGVGRQRLRELPWEGFIIYAAIGLSWYVAEALIHGMPFVRQVVGYHMFTRFFGVVDNQPGPWHYYVPVLVVGAFPWTAFLPATLIYHVRRMRQDGRSVLLILWMGMTFLFYSVAGTKLPNYILPLFPAAAIATARLWAVAVWERDPRASALLRLGSWLLLVMVGVVATTVLVILQPRYPAEFALLRTHLQLLVSLPLVAALLAVIPVRRPLAALGALLLFTSATYGVLVLATLPRVEALRPMKPLAEALKAALQPGDRIVGVGWTEPASVIYYAGHPAAQALPDAASVRRAACGPGRVFVVAARTDYENWLRDAFPGALNIAAERMAILILRTSRPIACAP